MRFLEERLVAEGFLTYSVDLLDLLRLQTEGVDVVQLEGGQEAAHVEDAGRGHEDLIVYLRLLFAGLNKHLCGEEDRALHAVLVQRLEHLQEGDDFFGVPCTW